MKKTTIIIKESQYNSLTKQLVESQLYTKHIKIILGDLVDNYEPVISAVSDGIEYKNVNRVKKKIDDSEMSPKQLLDYFLIKYNGLNEEFIKQIIIDWYNGDVSDNLTLTKNVSIMP